VTRHGLLSRRFLDRLPQLQVRVAYERVELVRERAGQAPDAGRLAPSTFVELDRALIAALSIDVGGLSSSSVTCGPPTVRIVKAGVAMLAALGGR
jgi:hypothetical protein